MIKRLSLDQLLLLLALGTAAVAMFLWLGSIPGLHGDEAWVGLRARDILNGSRPILGMTDYTGPIHQYLAAPFLKLFGFRVWALRCFGALSSVFSVYLYFVCVRELFDRRTAAISALVLALMPFFVLFGRIANEVFMLNPLLALGAIVFALKARKQRLYFALSGVCIGLGIWTHLIFLSFAIAFVVAGLFRMRKRFFVPACLVAAGAVLALLPRLAYQYASAPTWAERLRLPHGPGFALTVAQKLHEWPAELFQLIHGDLMFRRYTGAVLFPSLNLSLFFIGLGVLILLLRLLLREDHRAESSAFVFIGTLLAATLWISPANSDRYFLLPLLCAPLVIAVGLEGFFSLICAYGTKGARRLALGLAILIAGFQAARIGVNYFYSFRETGGRLSQFWMGGISETSNHYVDFSSLHRELLALGAKQVCSEFLISTPLEFYSIDGAYRNSWQDQVCKDLALHAPDGVYAVVFNSDPRIFGPSSFPGFELAFRDSHFTVLRAYPRKQR